MFLIQRQYIVHIMYLLIRPSGKNAVGILKVWLVKPLHGSSACLQYQIQGKVIGVQPLFNVGKFRVHRIPVIDAEGLHDGKGISPVSGGTFLRLSHRRDACLRPCKPYRADIVDTFAALADTVLYQIFDQISREMKLVIKIENGLNLRRRQCFSKVLVAHKEKLPAF